MTPAEYARPIALRRDKTLGYLYFIDKGHPLAHPSTGRVYHHRHVASVSVGRWLTRREIVHHDNDDRADNTPSNLIITTSVEHGRHHNPPRRPPRTCESCGSGTRNLRFCSQACRPVTKKFDPPAEELRQLVAAQPITHVAARFGVSDQAVRKRCKKLGIPTHPPGYWTKPPSPKG